MRCRWCGELWGFNTQGKADDTQEDGCPPCRRWHRDRAFALLERAGINMGDDAGDDAPVKPPSLDGDYEQWLQDTMDGGK